MSHKKKMNQIIVFETLLLLTLKSELIKTRLLLPFPLKEHRLAVSSSIRSMYSSTKIWPKIDNIPSSAKRSVEFVKRPKDMIFEEIGVSITTANDRVESFVARTGTGGFGRRRKRGRGCRFSSYKRKQIKKFE